MTGYETFMRILYETIHPLIRVLGADGKEKEPDYSAEELFFCLRDGEDIRECGHMRTRELYDHYQNSLSAQELAQKVLEEIQSMRNLGFQKKLRDFRENPGLFLSSLRIRLLPLEDARKRGSVLWPCGDMALALYLELGRRADYCYSMIIPDALLEGLSLEEEKLRTSALVNTMRCCPPRLYILEKILRIKDYEGDDFMAPFYTLANQGGPEGNCISTASRINGAAALFYPDVLPRLAQLNEGNLLIAFTSIHEAMVHREGAVDPDNLREILEKTIREATLPQDFLSYRIYRYNREKGNMEIVA